MSNLLRLSVALGLGLLGACRSSPWYDYRFSPAPLEAQVTSEADPSAQVRALVSVIGISRATEGRPDAVEVRMRLENIGRQPATLIEDSLSLVSADLESFGKASVHPTVDRTVPPGATKVFDISFPLPESHQPKDYNLRGLNLRWALSFAGREVTTGATFQRDETVHAYNDPNVHVGFGVGYVHH